VDFVICEGNWSNLERNLKAELGSESDNIKVGNKPTIAKYIYIYSKK
jgi:hypothetical protein